MNSEFFKFPQLFSYANGWRFKFMVYIDFDYPIYEAYFNAPSMVMARKILSEWRKDFLMLNEIIDDLYIYDLYNLSIGQRRKIK